MSASATSLPSGLLCRLRQVECERVMRLGDRHRGERERERERERESEREILSTGASNCSMMDVLHMHAHTRDLAVPR
jgi:hypothetical protein